MNLRNTNATQMFSGNKPFVIQLNESQKNSFVELFRVRSKGKEILRDFIDSVDSTHQNWSEQEDFLEYKHIYFTPDSCVTDLSEEELQTLKRKMFKSIT